VVETVGKPLRRAIYTRKSTEEGLDQAFNSLHAQREAGEAFVVSQQTHGWVVVPERYDDGGFTGAHMERPGLQRLLQDGAAMRRASSGRASRSHLHLSGRVRKPNIVETIAPGAGTLGGPTDLGYSLRCGAPLPLGNSSTEQRCASVCRHRDGGVVALCRCGAERLRILGKSRLPSWQAYSKGGLSTRVMVSSPFQGRV
jgi:hypothetical protein